MTKGFGRFLRHNTIAMIALFFALAGTTFAAATALPRNSVGTKQIKNNAVTSAKIKNNQVTGADVKESSLGKVPSAANADNATHATTADSATNATHATSADTASVANSLPALTWTSLALQNGWAPYSVAIYGVPGLQYTKDASGFVHLRGAVTGTSSTNVQIATLPAGVRPASGAWVVLSSTTGAFDPVATAAWIDSAGNVRVYDGSGGNNSFVSFEGAEFYTG